MTLAEFENMCTARRMPEVSGSREALKYILVFGKSVSEAANRAGCTYPAAYQALEKFKAWEGLILSSGYSRFN